MEGVVEGLMEGVMESMVSSPNLSTMPRRSLSVRSVTSPSPANPAPGCRADPIVSSCSVAEVATKEPEESGKLKLVKNVNKPSVAMSASKNDCRTNKYFNISEKKTTTSKIISRPRVKTKKWVRKKNGLFGWVTCVSDGKSIKIGLMGSNIDGEETKKESAAGDSSTKDLEGTESC